MGTGIAVPKLDSSTNTAMAKFPAVSAVAPLLLVDVGEAKSGELAQILVVVCRRIHRH